VSTGDDAGASEQQCADDGAGVHEGQEGDGALPVHPPLPGLPRLQPRLPLRGGPGVLQGVRAIRSAPRGRGPRDASSGLQLGLVRCGQRVQVLGRVRVPLREEQRGGRVRLPLPPQPQRRLAQVQGHLEAAGLPPPARLRELAGHGEVSE
jgi:hypothetical protein